MDRRTPKYPAVRAKGMAVDVKARGVTTVKLPFLVG
jgi:hypothetical protein